MILEKRMICEAADNLPYSAPEEARRFFEALGIDPARRSVHFIAIPEGPFARQDGPRQYYLPLSQAWHRLRAHQRESCGVFFCVQEMRASRRSKAEYRRARALFVDLDEKHPTLEEIQEMRVRGAQPVAALESSEGKFHVYWRLHGDSDLNVEGIEAALRECAQSFGGDPACTDAARVMRLPGTLHLKKAPRLVRLAWLNPAPEQVALSGRPRDAAEAPAVSAPPPSPMESAPADAASAAPVGGDNPQVAKLVETLVALPASISGAGGHPMAYHAACVAVGWPGLTHDERLAALVKWNRVRTGGRHWSHRELEHKLADAEARLSLEGPALAFTEVESPTEGSHEPFPIEQVPESVSAYARAVAAFAGADVAVCATLGLAALATAVGRQAMVEERPGLRHFPALFFCVVAGTGERKSPVFKAMLSPLDDLVAEWEVDWQSRIAQAQVARTAWDKSSAGLEKQIAAGKITTEECREAFLELGPRPTLPHKPRLYTNDATEERLVQLLSRTGEFAVLSGEARPVFNQILGRYAGGGMTGESVYLAAISGDTITRDRVAGGEEITIERPCLNVALMVQPDKFMELVNHTGLRDSGALARIWTLWPAPRAGHRLEDGQDRAVPEPVRASYGALLRGIRTGPEARGPTLVLPLDDAAAEGRRLFHNDMETRLSQLVDFVDGPDVIAKACSTASRLALVIQCALDGHARGPAISLEAWRRAEVLTRWYLDCTAQIRRLLQDGDAKAHAARTARWLRTTGRRTLCALDLHTRGPMPRPDRIKAKTVMAVLEEHGVVRASTRIGGATHIVNPAFLAGQQPERKETEDAP